MLCHRPAECSYRPDSSRNQSCLISVKISTQDLQCDSPSHHPGQWGHFLCPCASPKCPLSKIESKHQASKSLKIGNCKPGKRRSNVTGQTSILESMKWITCWTCWANIHSASIPLWKRQSNCMMPWQLKTKCNKNKVNFVLSEPSSRDWTLSVLTCFTGNYPPR